MVAASPVQIDRSPELIEPRRARYERSPVLLFRLLVAGVVVLIGMVVTEATEDTLLDLDTRLLDLFGGLPDSFGRFLIGLSQFLAVLLPVLVTIGLIALRQFRTLVVAAVGGAVGAALLALIDGVIGAPRPPAHVATVTEDAWIVGAAFPSSAYIAGGAAVATILAICVGRRWGRIAWAAVVVVALFRLLAGASVPAHLLLAIGVGWFVGTAVVLVFGAPDHAPTARMVADALAAAGLPVARLAPASVDARGSTPWFATTTDGTALFVKTLGRDERDADLLFRIYRYLRLKNVGDQRPFSSLRRAVEHEALVALKARDSGVRTPRVRNVATVAPDGMLLAYEAIDGRSIDSLDGDFDDELLAQIWTQVAILRRERIAHRDLRRANIFLGSDGEVWMIDFGFSELAASDRLLQADVAELIAATAVVTGAERAVAAAVAGIGKEAVGQSLPMLQPLALAGATHKAVAEKHGLMADLQNEVRRQSGVDDVVYEPLARVNARTALMLVSSLIALYVLIPQLTNVAGMVRQLRDADWSWVALTLVLSFISYIGASISLMAFAPTRVPAVDAFEVSLAGSFVNRITPAGVGGMGLNVRYLQKRGAETVEAASRLGVNSLLGVVIHLSLTLLFLLWAGKEGSFDFRLPKVPALVALLVVLVGAGVVFLLPWGRHRLLGPAVHALGHAWRGVVDLARQPAHLGGIVGRHDHHPVVPVRPVRGRQRLRRWVGVLGRRRRLPGRVGHRSGGADTRRAGRGGSGPHRRPDQCRAGQGGGGARGAALPAVHLLAADPARLGGVLPAQPSPPDLNAPLGGPSVDRPPTRRRFSPGDVIRLLAGMVVVGAGLTMALVGRSTAGGLELDVARQVTRLPERFVDGLLVAIQLLGLLVPLVGFGYLLARRRLALVAQLLLTGGVAAAVADGLAVLLEDHLLGPELARLSDARGVLGGSFPSPGFVAGVTALVTFGAPWMTRRWRQASWAAIAVVVLARLISSAVPLGEVLIAVGIGMIVGSVGLLCFGSPNPEPPPEELDRALSSLGMDAVEVARSHERGVRPAYHVREADGRTSFVKLRTPEDRDADFLSRLYRAARFRSVGLASPFASLKRQVEHEVFLSGMAREAGVRCPVVRAFGTTSSGSAFLVEELVDGQPVTEEELAQPDQLVAIWSQLAALHRGGIAHLALTTGNILIDHEGAPWLVDFDSAEAAADGRQRNRDVADLLVASALAAGVGPAVDVAVVAMGTAAVAGTLPLLQPLALAPGVRRRVRRDKQLLPDLRRAVQDATGAPEAQLARLERIRPRTLIVILGSTVAFYSLLPQLGNLGGTAERLRDANYLWLAVLLAASLATYLFATVCVLGSVPRTLQGPAAFRAQVASSFATLLGPGSSGSAALNLRFLERSGIGVPEATAAVALNAVSGFIVHGALLFAFVLWTGRAGGQRFSLPDANVILLVLAVLATLVGVALLVRPLRKRVLTPAVAALRSGLAEVGGVFRSPTRVLALFGGSAGLSLAYIAGLAAAVAAFGGDLAFPQVGTAYLAGSAIASLAPTPGGLGAVESALIAGLTGYGLSDGLAVSAVLTFRLATFWLPIPPGWWLAGWMERHREL